MIYCRVSLCKYQIYADCKNLALKMSMYLVPEKEAGHLHANVNRLFEEHSEETNHVSILIGWMTIEPTGICKMFAKCVTSHAYHHL